MRLLGTALLFLGLVPGCSSGPKPVPDAAAPAASAPPPQGSASAGLLNGLPPPKVTPPATTDSRARDSFARAVQLSQAGDLAGAEKALGDVLARDSKLDHAWTDLGVLAERRGDLASAEKDYRQALLLAPDQEAAWDFLSRLLCRQGRAQEAQQLAAARVAAAPAAAGPRNALAFALLQLNQPQAAETECKRVLKDDERNVRAMQLLSQAYFRQGKYELSKLVLENARAVDGSDAATHNLLGATLLKLKQKPQAQEEFRAAAQARPDFAEARNNYGVMLVEAGDYEGAVRELEAAVALAPDFVPARLNLGNAYRGKAELPRAEAQYQKVTQLQPALADTYFNLAILNLDSELPGVDTVERMNRAIAYFKTYRDKGGNDERVDQYLKDAAKGIDREQRRREREKKDQLRKVEKDKEAASSASKAPAAPAPASGKPASKLSDAPAPAAAPASATKPAKSSKPASKLSDTPAPQAPAKLGTDDK
jgi:Tfp pilus assembly protein PilF